MSLSQIIPRKHNQFFHLWTPAIEQRLGELWTAGTRVLIISDLLLKEFGIRFNKNAIIGKAHRLGLSRHKLAVARFTGPMDRAQRKARRMEIQRIWRLNNRDRMNANQRRYEDKLRERKIAPTIEDMSIPTPQRKTIYELETHSCRWPVGEPQSDLFFFCGAEAEEGKPYCSGHCARAFNVERRRDDATARPRGSFHSSFVLYPRTLR